MRWLADVRSDNSIGTFLLLWWVFGKPISEVCFYCTLLDLINTVSSCYTFQWCLTGSGHASKFISYLLRHTGKQVYTSSGMKEDFARYSYEVMRLKSSAKLKFGLNNLSKVMDSCALNLRPKSCQSCELHLPDAIMTSRLKHSYSITRMSCFQQCKHSQYKIEILRTFKDLSCK